MKRTVVCSFVCIVICMQHLNSNPINAFPPQLIAHHGFMHPAVMMPMYPVQYPGYPAFQPMAMSASNQDEVQHSSTTPAVANGKDTKKDDEEEEEVNKRDDDDTFWEAASSYGKNRWTNFKEGFTELWDVFRAAGRGVKNVFSSSD